MSDKIIVLGIVILFVILAFAYSVVIPLGEAPDEVPHFAYIQYLVGHRALPPPEGEVAGESHQPPLYYLLGALITSPIPRVGFQVINNPDFAFDDQKTPNLLLHDSRETFPYRDDVLAWHLARLMSIGMGAVTVWTTWKIGREIFRDDAWVAVAAMAFVAFLPGFVSISAVVNNDNLITMLASVSVLQIVRMSRARQPRDAIGLGITLGLAALSKLSGFVLWVFAAILFFRLARRTGKWKELVGDSTICFVIAVALVSPWLVYNLFMSGDPFGWRVILSSTPVRESPMTLNDWLGTLDGLYTSFWGRFGGALHLHMSNLIYAGLGVLAAMALIGWIEYAHDAPEGKILPSVREGFVWFAIFWASMLAAYVRWAVTVLGADMARQLFPGISLLSIVLVAGWVRFFGRWSKIAIGLALSGLALIAMAAVLYLKSVYTI